MKKRLSLLSVVSICTLTFLSGCSGPKVHKAETTLTVSAAASLTDCMEEIKAAFIEANPSIDVNFNFGASGALQQQIEQGAPADVFVSAGLKQMNALEEADLMKTESVKNLLENKVVLITPKEGSGTLNFKDLASDTVTKIAVGEPESVPVGQYSAQIFDHLGLTEAVASKLVYAKDVREVLSWVETGNVEAGVVYETDAKISEGVTICAKADETMHNPIIYPVGVVKSSTNPEAARAFVDFLFTKEVKMILESYGFSPLY